MDTVDLLMHPVRLRIVHAMSGRTLTTSQLCGRLQDVSKATIYRQVALLAEAGILEVADEHRVKGAVERSYRLQEGRVVIDPETAASMSLDQHRHGFATAMAGLIAEFDAYLARPAADLIADAVSYRQVTLWLSERERAEMIDELRKVIVARVENRPGPDRERHLMSVIFFPAEEPLEPA